MVLSRRLGESDSRRGVADGESRRVGGDSVFAVSHWCHGMTTEPLSYYHLFFLPVLTLAHSNTPTRQYHALDPDSGSHSQFGSDPIPAGSCVSRRVYVSTRRAHGLPRLHHHLVCFSSAAPVTHEETKPIVRPLALRRSPQTQVDKLRTPGGTGTPCPRWQHCASVPRTRTAWPAAPSSEHTAGCARRPPALLVRQCSSKGSTKVRL